MGAPEDEEKSDGLASTSGVKARRRLGFLEGQFTVPDDFDTMMAEEIEEMFYGNPDKLSDV